VTDSTNADTVYARNRIRSEVTPVLKELFDGLEARAVTMSEGLREDEECLSELTKDFLKRAVNALGMDTEALTALPRALQKRALREWIEGQTGHTPERTHLDALLSLANEAHEGQTRVSLTGDVCAVRELGRLCLRASREDVPTPFWIPLSIGRTKIGQTGIVVTVEREHSDTKVHSLSTEKHITSYRVFDIIEKDLYWRSRREGDTILLGGMHRKLRKLYNANRIPQRLRECLPLLCDGEGILLAPFVGCRDGLADRGEAYVITVALADQIE
jgi:tRNA(Ile)-lysidine synthase